MKMLICFAVVLIILYSTTSCNQCNNLECPPTAPETPIRIQSRLTGNDLAFGSTALYDKSKFSCFSLKGNDTMKYNIFWAVVNTLNNDSLLYIDLFPKTDTPIFFKLNVTDTDTLGITYQTTDSKCCGVFSTVTNFTYNGINIMPTNGTYIVKK